MYICFLYYLGSSSTKNQTAGDTCCPDVKRRQP